MRVIKIQNKSVLSERKTQKFTEMVVQQAEMMGNSTIDEFSEKLQIVYIIQKKLNKWNENGQCIHCKSSVKGKVGQ